MAVYTLLRVDPNELMKVYTTIERMDSVDEVSLITGNWDVLVKFSGESLDKDLQTIIKDVLTIPGVRQSETFISTKFLKIIP